MAIKAGTTTKTQAPIPPAPAANTRAANSTEVDMVKEGGVFKIPAQLNSAIILKFMVDSGCSSVQIPKDVFLTLQRTGSIQESDYLPGDTFVLADGSKVKSGQFILRSIKVGEATVADVEASVGGAGATLLLGQSFLSRFKEWKIDNTSAKLILTGSAAQAPVALEALEISQYMAPPPFGNAMENYEQSLARTRARELDGMRKIETLGLYAVAIRTVDQPVFLADGKTDWVLEMGEAFPFLGFIGYSARVKLGTTWLSVSREDVSIVRLSEHPDLAQKHQQMLQQFLDHR